MTSDAWITLDSRPLYESNLKTLESRKKDLPFLNTKDLDFKLNQSNFENSENIKLYSFETRVGIKIDESGTVTEETGLYFVDFLKLQKNTYWFLEVEADAEIIDILKSFPFAQLGSLNHTVSIKILDKHHHPFSSLIDWQKKELKEIEEDLNKNNPSIIALCFIQKTVIHYEYTPPVDGIKELDWTGKIDRLTQLLFQRPADVSMEYLGDIYTEKVLYGHYNQALHKLTHEYLTLEGYTIFFKISTKENNFFNFSGTLFSYSENDFFTSENGFGQFIIKKIDQL